MNFLRLFLRSIALVPDVIQGTEALFGAGVGAHKKVAALEIMDAGVGRVLEARRA